MEPWQRIFEEYLPRFAGNAPWVNSFLRKSRHIISSTFERTKRYQQDFEMAAHNIYTQYANTLLLPRLKSVMRKEEGFKVQKKTEFDAEEEKKDNTNRFQFKKQKNLVNSNLLDMQVDLYRVLESQIKQPAHPIQLLIKEFRIAFMKQYEMYVVPDTNNDGGANNIEKRQ